MRVFIALVTQHAKCMRRITLSSVACLYRNFPHYLINDTILVKMLLNIKCVFWSYINFCPSRLSFYQQRTSCMYVSLRVKHPLYLSHFNETSIFSNTEISNFMKMRPVTA